MPAPHWFAAVPGCSQVVVPPAATFQPWLERIVAAAAVENGYGFVDALTLTSGLGGDTGIGPYVGIAVSCRKAWIQPCWSIRCWNAWRKYSCLKIGPTFGLFRLSGK